MSPEEVDIKAIGLTRPEWKSLVLSTGFIDPVRLDHARSTVAKIGRYGATLSADTELLDWCLRRIAVTYLHYCLKGETFTDEEKVKLIQIRNGWSAEQAAEHFEKVKADRKAEAEIFGDLVPDPYPKSPG